MSNKTNPFTPIAPAQLPGRITQDVDNGPVDSRGAAIVEVLVTADHKKLWVNINGICWLRAQEITRLVIDKAVD